MSQKREQTPAERAMIEAGAEDMVRDLLAAVTLAALGATLVCRAAGIDDSVTRVRVLETLESYVEGFRLGCQERGLL